MRSSNSILVNVVLLVAFVQAPFLHTHLHEATQKHAGGFLHVHFRSVSPVSTSPALRGFDPDEDAIYEGWFSAPPVDSGSVTPVIYVEPFSFAIPASVGWPVETPLEVGHDPPLLCPRSPRAPPVLTSLVRFACRSARSSPFSLVCEVNMGLSVLRFVFPLILGSALFGQARLTLADAVAQALNSNPLLSVAQAREALPKASASKRASPRTLD